MYSIFQSILPIFALILLGSISKATWLPSLEFWRNLEKLAYYLLFPVTLFNYIYQADFNSYTVTSLIESLIFSTFMTSLLTIYLKEVCKINNSLFTSCFQGAIRHNSYIFLAVATSLYDLPILSIVAVTLGYMMIFTNILSIIAFNYYINSNEGSEEISFAESLLNIFIQLLTNPLVVSCILGFFANHLRLTFNPWIEKFLSNIADSATAIGVMCIGAGMRFRISTPNIKLAVYSSFIKLIVLPIITLFSFKLFNVTGILRSVGLLYSSLPCGVTCYILSKQLGGDTELMAFIITFSIIVSSASIACIMYLFW